MEAGNTSSAAAHGYDPCTVLNVGCKDLLKVKQPLVIVIISTCSSKKKDILITLWLAHATRSDLFWSVLSRSYHVSGEPPEFNFWD